MTDNSKTYYQASEGSLTGFNKAIIPSGGSNIATNGWSIEALKAFLLNESGLNFPTDDWVLQIETLIENHINNFNNPHEDTLDEIIGNVIDGILTNLTPGTPPPIPPFFAFDAVVSLPLGDILPASFSSAGIYRATDGGVFIDPATETEEVGTDYVNNDAGIPLFSSLTNIVNPNWATLPATAVNTTLAVNPMTGMNYPFVFMQVSETDAQGSFGVSIPATEALGTVYTFTAFVVGTTNEGSLVISQPGDTTNSMTMSLSDGSYTITGTDVIGETFVYPNGVIRVSFSFITSSTNPDNAVQILHMAAGDTSTVRTGTAGTALFSIGSPQQTTATLNQPVTTTYGSAGTTTPFTLNLGAIPAPATMSNLMVRIGLNIYPTLSTAAAPDAVVFSMGALQITRDQTNVYVVLNGTTLFTSALLNGLNVFTLSYSPTTLIFKDLKNARQVATGTYAPLSTTSVLCGPCAGYLKYLTLYSRPDTNQTVEFLTNG